MSGEPAVESAGSRLEAGRVQPAEPVPSPQTRQGMARPALRIALGVAGALLLLLSGTGYDSGPARVTADPLEEGAGIDRGGDPDLRQAAVRVTRLAATLRQMTPRGSYIVIDQTHNRIRLMRGRALVLEAPCSAGSGLVLRESAEGRVWVFDTPRGAFSVLSKLENPVWRKPDWAFIEEGLPIPQDAAERFEYGALGEYALYFGNGYMIHGTLYERLIGRPVSHGCIRVGREALRQIYRAVPLGARVYIY